MYEARQNKEKVSRRIDGNGGTKLRVQLRDMRSVQRRTQIEYYTQVLHIAGIGSCIVGKRMDAFLDPNDPVRGSATNKTVQGSLMNGLTKHGPTNNYLKGHLLNHDLGGLAIAANLFPITYEMNNQHSSMAEKPVKHSLYAGNPVYYTVETTNQKTNFNSINEFIRGNYGFRWGASNNNYPQTLHSNQIRRTNNVNDVYKGQWSHYINGKERKGLSQKSSSDITSNTLNHSLINGESLSPDINTMSRNPYYKG